MGKRVLTCEDAINDIYDEYQNVDTNKIDELFDTAPANDPVDLATKLANIVDSIGADKSKNEKAVVDNKIRLVVSSKAAKNMEDKELVPMIIEAIMGNNVYREAATIAKTDTAKRLLHQLYSLSYTLGKRRYEKYILDVLDKKYFNRNI